MAEQADEKRARTVELQLPTWLRLAIFVVHGLPLVLAGLVWLEQNEIEWSVLEPSLGAMLVVFLCFGCALLWRAVLVPLCSVDVCLRGTVLPAEGVDVQPAGAEHPEKVTQKVREYSLPLTGFALAVLPHLVSDIPRREPLLIEPLAVSKILAPYLIFCGFALRVRDDRTPIPPRVLQLFSLGIGVKIVARICSFGIAADSTDTMAFRWFEVLEQATQHRSRDPAPSSAPVPVHSRALSRPWRSSVVSNALLVVHAVLAKSGHIGAWVRRHGPGSPGLQTRT